MARPHKIRLCCRDQTWQLLIDESIFSSRLENHYTLADFNSQSAIFWLCEWLVRFGNAREGIALRHPISSRQRQRKRKYRPFIDLAFN